MIKYDLFIHVHYLNFKNISLMDSVLSLTFNKENKMSYIRWVESRSNCINCRLCKKYMTELLKKGIK
jgi:hypothetical protein